MRLRSSRFHFWESVAFAVMGIADVIFMGIFIFSGEKHTLVISMSIALFLCALAFFLFFVVSIGLYSIAMTKEAEERAARGSDEIRFKLIHGGKK